MKQIVRLAAMAGTKSAGMPVEDVGPITESAENIGTARRLSRIELDHEYGLAALDRGSHATQYLDFEPFHVDLHKVGREGQVVDRDDRHDRLNESQSAPRAQAALRIFA
jgi:hypothetical protein